LGDNADMAMIELVDFNELYTGGKKKLKSKSRRGGKAKKADEATEAQLLRLILLQTLLNSYECNCFIRIKLFVVYPFFLLFEQSKICFYL
jgi:hypothetical protein